MPHQPQLLAVSLPDEAFQSDDDAGSAREGSPVTNTLHLLSKRPRQPQVLQDGRTAPKQARVSADCEQGAQAQVAMARPTGASGVAVAPGTVCRSDLSGVVAKLHAASGAPDQHAKQGQSCEKEDVTQGAPEAHASQAPQEGVASSRRGKKKQRQHSACFPYGNYHRCELSM